MKKLAIIILLILLTFTSFAQKNLEGLKVTSSKDGKVKLYVLEEEKIEYTYEVYLNKALGEFDLEYSNNEIKALTYSGDYNTNYNVYRFKSNIDIQLVNFINNKTKSSKLFTLKSGINTIDEDGDCFNEIPEEKKLENTSNSEEKIRKIAFASTRVYEEEETGTLTIYYKSEKASYINYNVGNNFSGEPGDLMNNSFIDGYKVIYLNNIQYGTKIKANFSDGNGIWYNTNTYNFRFIFLKSNPIITVENGTIIYGNPKTTKKDIALKVYYKNSFTKAYIYYSINGNWNKLPGAKMKNSDVDGYLSHIVDYKAGDIVKISFNDGYNNWDNLWNKNYTIAESADLVTIENGKVLYKKPFVKTVIINEAPIIMRVLPDEGNYFDELTVKIVASDDNDDPIIYYTVDGTNPDNNSTKYTSAGVILKETSTIKFIAYDSEGLKSEIQSYNYQINAKLPSVFSSLSNGSKITIEKENIKLTVRNATEATYRIDNGENIGEVKNFVDGDILEIFGKEKGEIIKLNLWAKNIEGKEISRIYNYYYEYLPPAELRVDKPDFEIKVEEVELKLTEKYLDKAEYILLINDRWQEAVTYNDGDIIRIGRESKSYTNIKLILNGYLNGEKIKTIEYNYYYRYDPTPPLLSASLKSGDITTEKVKITLYAENSSISGYQLLANGKELAYESYSNGDIISFGEGMIPGTNISLKIFSKNMGVEIASKYYNYVYKYETKNPTVYADLVDGTSIVEEVVFVKIYAKNVVKSDYKLRIDGEDETTDILYYEDGNTISIKGSKKGDIVYLDLRGEDLEGNKVIKTYKYYYDFDKNKAEVYTDKENQDILTEVLEIKLFSENVDEAKYQLTINNKLQDIVKYNNGDIIKIGKDSKTNQNINLILSGLIDGEKVVSKEYNYYYKYSKPEVKVWVELNGKDLKENYTEEVLVDTEIKIELEFKIEGEAKGTYTLVQIVELPDGLYPTSPAPIDFVDGDIVKRNFIMPKEDVEYSLHYEYEVDGEFAGSANYTILYKYEALGDKPEIIADKKSGNLEGISKTVSITLSDADNGNYMIKVNGKEKESGTFIDGDSLEFYS